MNKFSLRIKVTTAAVTLCMVVAVATGLLALWSTWRDAISDERIQLERGAALAVRSLEDIGRRMGGHTALVAANPQVQSAVASGDRAQMERTVGDLMKTLMSADPSVATLEMAGRDGRCSFAATIPPDMVTTSRKSRRSWRRWPVSSIPR